MESFDWLRRSMVETNWLFSLRVFDWCFFQYLVFAVIFTPPKLQHQGVVSSFEFSYVFHMVGGSCSSSRGSRNIVSLVSVCIPVLILVSASWKSLPVVVNLCHSRSSVVGRCHSGADAQWRLSEAGGGTSCRLQLTGSHIPWNGWWLTGGRDHMGFEEWQLAAEPKWVCRENSAVAESHRATDRETDRQPGTAVCCCVPGTFLSRNK